LGAQALESCKIPLRVAASHSIIKSTSWTNEKKRNKDSALFCRTSKHSKDAGFLSGLQHLNLFLSQLLVQIVFIPDKAVVT